MAVAPLPSLLELLSADMEWSSRLWSSQSHYRCFEVTYVLSLLFMIFMRYLFPYFREISVASLGQIAASHHPCNRMRISQLPEWSPSQVFSDTTWPRHAWSLMTAGRPHFLYTVSCSSVCAGGCLGQPRRGLTLVCVFALAPCQGKENTWSWSPVLSADIFGKGCWIQVCVWSCASPSQVQHRETQRLLHFSV